VGLQETIAPILAYFSHVASSFVEH